MDFPSRNELDLHRSQVSRWHSVTAEDVRWSIERSLSVKAAAGVMAVCALTHSSQLKVIDERTFQVLQDIGVRERCRCRFVRSAAQKNWSDIMTSMLSKELPPIIVNCMDFDRLDRLAAAAARSLARTADFLAREIAPATISPSGFILRGVVTMGS